MVARRIHLVRHGEVFNPDGILYGRMPGYHLSERGARMAKATADYLSASGVVVTRLCASPLQRTRESAQPIAQEYGLDIEIDSRLIEPTNHFEGRSFEAGAGAALHPRSWPWIWNPWRPSWGEPYASIAKRMLAAMDAAWAATESDDAVLVSHQLPIWMVHRSVAGERLFHDPRQRRCALSSVTTFERRGEGFVETGYVEPASDEHVVDVGAV